MLDQTEAVEARAIVAHRHTGQLKTVNASAVGNLGSAWVFVCREPDELVGYETDSAVREPERVRLHHRHDFGNPVDGCPALGTCDYKPFEMPPAEYWTAEDLASLHDVIRRWLQDDGAIWAISVEPKGDRWVTTIEVSTFHSMGRKGPRGQQPHDVKLVYAGVPNAATLTWFARQGTRYYLSVAIGPQTYLPKNDVPKARRPQESK